jgi:hypothetical protein
VKRLPTEEPLPNKASPAVARLKHTKEQAEKRLQTCHEYLEWLPDDLDQAQPEPHADEHAGGVDGARWRAPLDQSEPRLEPELTGADNGVTAEATVTTGGVSNPRRALRASSASSTPGSQN